MKQSPTPTRFPLIGLFAITLCSILSAQVLAQQPSAPASPVKVEAIKETLFAPTVDVIGTIYSRHNVQLTAGVAGRLDFAAEPGTYVKKGDEVARIDPLSLQLQQAEQGAQIKRAKINQSYLKRELDRLRDLRETNSASVFQLDQIQSQYELAIADREIAELRLRQIQDQLSRTVIHAPFDGVVSERLREAGGEVNRSDTLLTLIDTRNLEGRIRVPVKYLSYIRELDTVKVAIDKQQVFAPIKAIIPATDMRSQSFELRVSLPVSDQDSWTSGQLIKASLPVQHAKQALTVHRDALILRQDGTYVVVVDGENKAHRKLVEVGEGQAQWVSIEGSALQEGDQVVTRGAERLQEGQVVAIDVPTA